MGVGEKKLFASRVGQSNPGVKNIAIGAFVGAAAVYGLGLLTSNNVATYPSMLMRAVPDAHDNIAAAAAIGCPTVGHVTIVVNDNIEDGQYNFLARDFESAKGEKWSLFKPMVEHADFLKGVPVLMAHPESWIKAIETKLQYLDQVTTGWKDGPIGERAREAYLQGKISLLFFSDVTSECVPSDSCLLCPPNAAFTYTYRTLLIMYVAVYTEHQSIVSKGCVMGLLMP